ncbi:DUF4258 domain-containing protein [Poritiphilus flavus]|uniref:DUF4258 domain-containing protein n=1 Tax=Poritiphilus flavus TaxID=2697053 RepID=A0A6L9EFS5_9FLAO|nr:DUF4258 domain-containing protein [Poritiphilus flavus]NAS13597.1 DUF4258 domain-containing protein [Poritiphilus flavus]
MPLLKRIGLYLVGLSIGLIFLTLFLKKKSDQTGTEFCYLPNCRVLKDLRSKPISYSGSVEAMMQDQVLDSAVIARFLSDGDIDFGLSDTKAEPCKTYVIEAELRTGSGKLTVSNCPDSLVIDNLELSQ